MTRNIINIGSYKYLIEHYNVIDDLKTNEYISEFVMLRNFTIMNNIIYDNDIYIIDPNGLETLENLGLEDIDLCSIYINVPIDVRLERALYRGDSLEDFFSRNKSEMRQFIQMKAAGGFDYAISNLNEDKAYAVLKYIVEVETVQN